MKKVLFILTCVIALAAFAVAANTYTPSEDVLGAHNNGGRGCAGCHAPHSGLFGAGGNVGTGLTVDTAHAGNDALFAQDLGPLYGYTLNMGDSGKFVETLPASTAFAVGDEEIRGIMMCLACHDGNIAKGAMMTGKSYEQQMGLLPVNLYGGTPIPTLLGNDGTTAGNYNNDHPVGVMATLGAAHLGSSNLTVTLDGTGTSITSIVPTGSYATFVSDYGMPAIAGTAWGYGVAVNPGITVGATNPATGKAYTAFDKLYLTCTTCHNQHVMNVYKGVGKGATNGYTSASDTGTYRTFFFINGPYNLAQAATVAGHGATTTQAQSTTQFCRQCHFSTSNENYGLALPTAF